MNPKDLAIQFMKPYVDRGDSLMSLLAGCGGLSCTEYSVQFGGYAWNNNECVYHAKRDEVIVTRLDNKDCLFIFKADNLYDEIRNGQQKLF